MPVPAKLGELYGNEGGVRLLMIVGVGEMKFLGGKGEVSESAIDSGTFFVETRKTRNPFLSFFV